MKRKLSVRIIDNDIRLIPYYKNDEISLRWYQDLKICKQVDNRDGPYDLKTLHNMYNFLSTHGNCYYIEYKGELVGDVSIRDDGEIAIMICKKYQNMHIGRKCIMDIINLAKEKGMSFVTAKIYSFNKQSQKMFEAVGFKKIDAECYEYRF